jgi:hypothetical protein
VFVKCILLVCRCSNDHIDGFVNKWPYKLFTTVLWCSVVLNSYHTVEKFPYNVTVNTLTLWSRGSTLAYYLEGFGFKFWPRDWPSGLSFVQATVISLPVKGYVYTGVETFFYIW